MESFACEKPLVGHQNVSQTRPSYSQFLWDHALMMTLGTLLITICIALLKIIPLLCTVLTIETGEGFLWLIPL